MTEASFSVDVQVGAGMESTACVLCGESKTVVLFDALSDVRYGGIGLFALRRCTQCGLIWLSPRPNPERAKEYYGANYVPYEDRATRMRTTLEPLRGLLSLPYRVRYGPLDQTSPPPRSGARMLDVGCGPGGLLERMRNIGWDVSGIEMDAQAAHKAALRAGGDDRIFTGPVESAHYPDGSFDLITASHVLEHLHNPMNALEHLHRWLRPGGYLKIWIPNIASIESRIFRKNWSGLDIPRHLHFFSLTTISRLLTKAGFELVSSRPQFQGSSFADSVKQSVARLAGHAGGSPASGLLYHAAVPIGWLLCGLGSSASLEVQAVATDEPHPSR